MKKNLEILRPEHAAALQKKDPFLGTIIDYLGELEMEADASLFEALIHHIFKQQISTALAEKIYCEFHRVYPLLSPEVILAEPFEQLCSFGISRRRMEWIVQIAEILAKDPDYEAKLLALPLEKQIETLMELPGVGFWTVEMILIFYFQNPHVLSYGDLGIHKGMQLVYGLEQKLDPDQFEEFRRLYAPYESLASLYIWKVQEGFVPWLQWKQVQKERKDRSRKKMDTEKNENNMQNKFLTPGGKKGQKD